ncbi:MAG TPA: hypothetical protein VG013_16730, partial [Gemmataceae bacterium]|nr:hypothetical protein [Gemmataceae bacterium]
QVEVTGRLNRIRRVQLAGRFSNGSNVYVLSVEGVYQDSPLWFEFVAKDQKQLAALKPRRQDVTIRAQCKGRTAIVADGKPEQVILFSDCKIVGAKQANDKPATSQPQRR